MVVVTITEINEAIEKIKELNGSYDDDHEVFASMSEDVLANHEVASAAVQSRGFNLGWLRDPTRDVVLVAVNDEGCALSYVNAQLQGDRDVVLAAVKSDGFALQFASEVLRADREVVLAAVTRGIIYDLHEYRQHDIEFYFEEGDEDEEQLTAPLSFAAAPLLGDKACVVAAVSSDPGTFKLISAELQRDRDVILAALKMEPEILCKLDDSSSYLISNREFALEAIEQNANVVEHFHETIRDDREVMLKAVAKNALVIRHASDALRADKSIALTILREENAQIWKMGHICKSFRTFSTALRAEKEVVLEALKACDGYFIDPKINVLDFVSREFKSDRDVVLTALKCCKIPYADGVLMWVSDVLLSDPDIITAAVKLHPTTLRHAAASLRGDRRFILDVLAHNRKHLSSHCASMLEHCSVSLRDDREVVHAAVEQYSAAMQFASERLQADKDTVLLAATGPQGGSSLQFASKVLRADKDIVLQVVAKDGTALGHASIALRGDKDVVTTAVCGDADIIYHHLGPLKHACISLQDDPAFLKTLCGKLNMKHVASKYEKKQAESREKSYHAEQLAHSTTQDCVADLWRGREEGTAVNIELATSDGARLPAHQEILMLRSPVFCAMFASGFQEGLQGEQEGCRVVSIEDFDSDILTELLRFVYTGCVAPQMLASRAQTLFEVANKS